MREDGMCWHCKERPAVGPLPEYQNPVPEQFKSTVPVLCEPCQHTADAWLTPEVYASAFPHYVLVPASVGRD